MLRNLVITNKIQCNHCQDIIESKSVHDYRSCQCGKISVDGGKEYFRRGFQKDGDIVELSESLTIEDSRIKELKNELKQSKSSYKDGILKTLAILGIRIENQ